MPTGTAPRDQGALSLWLWPELRDGIGRHRSLRIVHPEYPTPSPHRLVTVNDLKREQAELDTVAQWTVGIAAGLVLLTAAGAWCVAGRTLRPMEAIRRQFTELSTHRLDQRVPVPKRNNEISRLAVTMNDTLMLARLDPRANLYDSGKPFQQRNVPESSGTSPASTKHAPTTPAEPAWAWPSRWPVRCRAPPHRPGARLR